MFIELHWAVKPQTDNGSEFLAPYVSMGPFFYSEAEFGVWQEAHSLCPVSHVPSHVPHPVATPLLWSLHGLATTWAWTEEGDHAGDWKWTGKKPL